MQQRLPDDRVKLPKFDKSSRKWTLSSHRRIRSSHRRLLSMRKAMLACGSSRCRSAILDSQPSPSRVVSTRRDCPLACKSWRMTFRNVCCSELPPPSNRPPISTSSVLHSTSMNGNELCGRKERRYRLSGVLVHALGRGACREALECRPLGKADGTRDGQRAAEGDIPSRRHGAYEPTCDVVGCKFPSAAKTNWCRLPALQSPNNVLILFTPALGRSWDVLGIMHRAIAAEPDRKSTRLHS